MKTQKNSKNKLAFQLDVARQTQPKSLFVWLMSRFPHYKTAKSNFIFLYLVLVLGIPRLSNELNKLGTKQTWI